MIYLQKNEVSIPKIFVYIRIFVYLCAVFYKTEQI